MKHGCVVLANDYLVVTIDYLVGTTDYFVLTKDYLVGTIDSSVVVHDWAKMCFPMSFVLYLLCFCRPTLDL